LSTPPACPALTIKMRTKNMKQIMMTIILVVIMLFLGFSITISNTSITPANATSSQNIYCNWNLTGYEEYNITWYKNGVIFNSTTNAISPWGLPYVHTTKDDVWNCTIWAFNESATPKNTTQSIKITIRNSPPTTPRLENASNVDIGTIEHIYEDTPYTFNLKSSDYDGDTLTYSESTIIGNDYCSINSANGTLSCNATSEPNTAINDLYQFLVNDGENIVGLLVRFNVTPVNDRPSFSTAIINKTIYENQTLQYSVTMTDEEDPNGPFTFHVNSSFNPERLVNVTSDNKTFTIQFTNNRKANFSDIGNQTVTITGCDPDNASLCVSSFFRLEVISINHAPEFTYLVNASGTQGDRLEMYINATDDDLLDVLNFSITSGCGLNVWNLTIIEESYNNASALVNLTLTNDHIICRNVTVYVTDSKETTSANLALQLINTNDVPILYNLSFHSGNTLNNHDLYSLNAYTGAAFLYKLNVSDIDSDTYEGESLTYYINSSLCNGIYCPTLTYDQTGIITFMPNNSYLGTYHYLVNVSDDDGESAYESMYITVIANNVPYFNETPTNQTAYEDTLFIYKLNATDPENSFDKFSDNTSLFDISSTGLISFTKNCSYVNNYTVTILINDTLGATNHSTFNIEILPVGDAPSLPTVQNTTILEEYPYYLSLAADTSDEDISCGDEDSLTFSSSFLSGPTIFSITSAGIISFTPNSTHSGSYLVNISVVDIYGLRDSTIWNLTIVNRSSAPNIINITPSGIPMNTSLISRSNFANNLTNTNTTENSTIVFDQNTLDLDGDPLYYNWTVNGAVVGHNKNYSRYFGFSDSGHYNVSITVSDNVSGLLAHYVRFTWNLTINNLNRAPLLNSSLPNITNLTTQYRWTNYLVGGIGNVRFNDPDEDTLTYTNTPTTYVTITYDGNDAIFTPVSLGTDHIVFTAFDGLATKSSNNVTINVTGIPNTTQNVQSVITIISNSGGGESTTFVPYSVIEEVEVDKEVYLEIIAPEPAVLYDNNTLRQVLSIINTGNKTLHGIYLSAVTNSSTAKLEFSNNYFPELHGAVNCSLKQYVPDLIPFLFN